MWVEDLYAWQQVNETEVSSPADGSSFALIDGNPQRVILSITVAQGAALWITTTPGGRTGLPFLAPGIQIGSGRWLIRPFLSLPTPDEQVFTGNLDPVTGAFSGSLGSVYKTQGYSCNPNTRIFTWHEHGVLPGMAWWGVASEISVPVHILSITMPRRPECKPWHGGESNGRQSRILPMSANQSIWGACWDDKHKDSRPEPAKERLVILADES